MSGTEIDERLLSALLSAKRRADAGDISTLEAAIEQIEAMLTFPPIPIGARQRRAMVVMIDALRDYIDGDETALKAFLGMPQ
jgi:hypothetical protein